VLADRYEVVLTPDVFPDKVDAGVLLTAHEEARQVGVTHELAWLEPIDHPARDPYFLETLCHPASLLSVSAVPM
jgi:murein tripeptide amidase MpaA